MKIIVCGDSYCSADSSDERWHFSQVLEDKYNLEVVNLARGGMSNLGICFQLKQAIALEPDAVVYNMADPSRVDIVMHDNYYTSLGLKNFVYHSPDDSSYGSEYVGNQDSPIFSTVFQELDSLTTFKVPAEKILAVKHYHAHLFNWQLKYDTDRWMLDYWRMQLKTANIRTVFLGNFADSRPIAPGRVIYDFVRKNPEYITKKLYHTDQATQQTAADLIAKEICLTS